MTRRPDVVRSNFTADPTTPRTRGGGCIILCSNWSTVYFGSGNPASIGPIQVTATENYQRIFVAATLDRLHHYGGGDIYVLIDTSAVGRITSITTGGGSECLTGVGDLPAGTHDIYVHLDANATDGGGDAYVADVFFQVIVGQIVATAGCPSGGGGSGGDT